MKSENAIEVRNITKKFKVYMDKGRTLKELTIFSKRRKYEERLVLRGISFDVKRGEAIGLIGHNGCGKSTTLKLLTRIMYPDAGTIDMCGRVSSLIELGAGFHPDMSGRQNIYTNASIFGLTRKEIDARMERIIAFSELEEFIDNPVRTYSSGMYMRLAFSVAINVDADILLIDEILAVGDANFQAKCFNKLKEIKAQGTTIVIVSHALGQIERICERSIWINEGKIRAEGTPREVHPIYMEYMGQKRQEIIEKEQEMQEKKEKKKVKKDDKTEESMEQKHDGKVEKIRWGNGYASISSVKLLNRSGEAIKGIKTGEGVKLVIDYDVKKAVIDAVIGIGIFGSDNIRYYGTNTQIDQLENFDLKKAGSAIVNFSEVMLLPGKYSVDIAIESVADGMADFWSKAIEIEIYSDVADVGVSRLAHQWTI